MTDGLRKNLQFGPFELSIRERVLRRDGVALPLGDRALDILSYLAERPGEVVAKRELMDHVWTDVNRRGGEPPGWVAQSDQKIIVPKTQQLGPKQCEVNYIQPA